MKLLRTGLVFLVLLLALPIPEVSGLANFEQVIDLPPAVVRQGSLDIGINIDPTRVDGYPSTYSLTGVDWVRLEFKDCTHSNHPGDVFREETLPAYRDLVDYYAQAGVGVILIIDYLSYPRARHNVGDLVDRARLIAEELQADVVYEVWNEPSIWQGGNLDATEYASLLSQVSAAIKQATNGEAVVVSGGLVGGDSTAPYLAAVRRAMGSSWSLIDGVGIHPYGYVPPSLGEDTLTPYIESVYEVAGKPLWMTEIGYPGEPAEQAQYLRAFIDHARRDRRIQAVVWFCWSDAMVPEYGLVDDDNHPKAAYWALQGGYVSLVVPQRNPPITFPLERFGYCTADGSIPTRSFIRDILGNFQ